MARTGYPRHFVQICDCSKSPSGTAEPALTIVSAMRSDGFWISISVMIVKR